MKGTISGSSTSKITRVHDVQFEMSIDQISGAFGNPLRIHCLGDKATSSVQMELQVMLQPTCEKEDFTKNQNVSIQSFQKLKG